MKPMSAPDFAVGDLGNLPCRLPANERILWQGRPCWKTMARRAFHLRGLTLYFAALLVWYAATQFSSGDTPVDAALATLLMIGIALVPLLLVVAYAWMSSRAAIYTITNRRVVMRIGIAMPITFSLPFSRIEAAATKMWSTGHGDIALQLGPKEHLAYLVLWPHAKPRRLTHPEPLLRCLPDALLVSQVLARALAASADLPVTAAVEMPLNETRAAIRPQQTVHA